MSPFLETLCAQIDRLMRICESLQECLDVERKALIQLKMEEILQNNILKETAIAHFAEEKQKLQSLIRGELGVSQLAEVEGRLSGVDSAVWSAKFADWKTVWGKTRKLCIRNREFLALSQKNLEAIHQNLMDLFGMKPLYDGQGNKVAKQGPGRVMEAKA